MIKLRIVLSSEKRRNKAQQLKELTKQRRMKAKKESDLNVTRRIENLCVSEDLKQGTQEILNKETEQCLKDIDGLVEYKLKQMTEQEVNKLTGERLQDFSEDLSIMTEKRLKVMRDNCFNTVDEQILIIKSKTRQIELMEFGLEEVVEEWFKQLNEKKLKAMALAMEEHCHIDFNMEEILAEHLLTGLLKELDDITEQRMTRKVEGILQDKGDEDNIHKIVKQKLEEMTGKEEQARIEHKLLETTENGLQKITVGCGKHDLVKVLNQKNAVTTKTLSSLVTS